MLKNMKKNITLTASSIVTVANGDTTNEVIAENYQATINSDNPDDMTISSWQQDKAAYKAHRTQCRQDSAEFEDAAYAIQDELIAEAAKTE